MKLLKSEIRLFLAVVTLVGILFIMPWLENNYYSHGAALSCMDTIYQDKFYEIEGEYINYGFIQDRYKNPSQIYQSCRNEAIEARREFEQN